MNATSGETANSMTELLTYYTDRKITWFYDSMDQIFHGVDDRPEYTTLIDEH